MDYSCTGASTGQTFAHAPHSMHSSGFITYLSSPALMQLTGHSGSHAPQLMQASVILYAIPGHLLKISFIILPLKHAIENPVNI